MIPAKGRFSVISLLSLQCYEKSIGIVTSVLVKKFASKLIKPSKPIHLWNTRHTETHTPWCHTHTWSLLTCLIEGKINKAVSDWCEPRRERVNEWIPLRWGQLGTRSSEKLEGGFWSRGGGENKIFICPSGDFSYGVMEHKTPWHELICCVRNQKEQFTFSVKVVLS